MKKHESPVRRVWVVIQDGSIVAVYARSQDAETVMTKLSGFVSVESTLIYEQLPEGLRK